jgi:hypothetical protein
MKIGKLYLLLTSFILVLFLVVYAQRSEEGYVYIVKHGDTLWDISARFLNNPWLWPKVWEQNRYITNPHLIFPGDPIALGVAPPAVAAAPAPEVKVAEVPPPPVEGIPPSATQPALSSEEMAAVPGEAPPPPPQAEEGLTQEEMAAAPEGEEESIGEVMKVEEVGEGNLYYSSASAVSFVTPEEFSASGSIVGSKLERTMFGQHDEVYVKTFEDAQVGQRYTIYRTEGKLKHTVTGETLGYNIKVLGEAEITEKDKETYTAKITKSYDVIRKDDRLKPVESVTTEIVLKSSEQQLEGYIVATQENLKLTGEGQLVYIDKGISDGITEGNIFTIYRPARKLKDRISGEEIESPIEIIGKLVVVKARENVSTALITKSKKEITTGDHIVSEVF